MLHFVINTLGRDGPKAFRGEAERNGLEWTYRIPANNKADFFEGRFREVGEGWIQVVMLARHCPEFNGQGIPEALFAKVIRDSGMRLRSSRREDDEFGFRTEDAERVWCRVMRAGLARYDEVDDRFVYLGT